MTSSHYSRIPRRSESPRDRYVNFYQQSSIAASFGLSPVFSGVWPIEEEFVSVYREMVKVSASLKDLSHK